VNPFVFIQRVLFGGEDADVGVRIWTFITASLPYLIIILMFFMIIKMRLGIKNKINGILTFIFIALLMIPFIILFEGPTAPMCMKKKIATQTTVASSYNCWLRLHGGVIGQIISFVLLMIYIGIRY